MKDSPDNKTTDNTASNSRLGSKDAVSAKSREIAKRLPALGYVTWLCSHSQAYRKLFMQDLEWRIFPPVILDQYKLYTDSKVGGLPTAYASWAFLSSEVEEAYRSTQRLRPGDWRSGEHLWLVDFVTPFSGAPALLEDLYYQIHASREIRLLYPDASGSPVETTLSEMLREQAAEDETSRPDNEDDPTRH